MNTPTPTPRTDAAWSATFDSEQMSAGKTARALRECSQQLETELATLRAELEKVYALVTPVGFDLPGGIFETAQAVTALTAECDQLRAEAERLRSDRDCEKRLRKDADELREDAIERAMKAKADLVALEQCHDDNCRGVVKIADELAAERARLKEMAAELAHCAGYIASVRTDRLITWHEELYALQTLEWAEGAFEIAEKANAVLEAHDAAMKEGTK